MDAQQEPHKIRKAGNISRNWKALLKVSVLFWCIAFVYYSVTRGRRCSMTTKAVSVGKILVKESWIKEQNQGGLAFSVYQGVATFTVI